jgi:hypothetical protein
LSYFKWNIHQTKSIFISWNKLGTYQYSLDINKYDGTTISHCLSSSTLQSNTSKTFSITNDKITCPDANSGPLEILISEIKSISIFVEKNSIWKEAGKAFFDEIAQDTTNQKTSYIYLTEPK